MSKRAEYVVLSNGSLPRLEQEVTLMLNGGWRLVGGHSVVNRGEDLLLFYQAMTKGGKSA
jgi:hypothetical protein